MPVTSCQVICERIDILAYNVRGFRLKLAQPAALPFAAGQFVIVNIPKDGKTVKRAYSIASSPHEPNALELCIQHVEGGAASTYFWGLKEGDKLSISGPHGTFQLKQPIDYDPVFMATGTGVAPLRSMIKHLFTIGTTRQVWLLFGTRYEHSLLYESEFRTLTKLRPNFHYIPTVSRPKDWRGETGHIQDTFKRTFPDVAEAAARMEIYICGVSEVIKSVYSDLAATGIPKEKLHYEEWA
jgi:ferredoxin-NADP reductase